MLIVDEQRIKENILYYKIKNDCMVVLKNNAYGFGLTKIAKIAYQCNVDKFCVDSMKDAITLRKKYPNILILLIGLLPKNLDLVKKYNIMVSVNNINEYNRCKDYMVKMHINIDVGMNRFGFKTFDRSILESDLVCGVYMHTYSSNNNVNKMLLSNFIQQISNFSKLIHIGGSSMIFTNSPYCIRFGYGIYKDCISLYGKIIEIKKISKGECIGYDSKFIASEDTLVGICDIGYSAGLSRNTPLFARVYIKGRYYHIIGNKCMNHCFILIDSEINVSDMVEFLGENIKLNEFASYNLANTYEILLRLH